MGNDVLSDGKFTFRVVTALNVVDPTYEAEYERSLEVANTAGERLSGDQLQQLHHLRQGIRIIKVQYGEMLPTLPLGWEELRLKTDTGKRYYYNSTTKATQWERPRGSHRDEWVPHNSNSRNYAFEDLKGSCKLIGKLEPLGGTTVLDDKGVPVARVTPEGDKEPPLVWRLKPTRR